MSSPSIRTIALCVLKRGQEILVQESYDSYTKETFYRPPGGGIEFGEFSWDAVRREMKEELSLEIDNLDYLGTLENIFQYEGRPRHEIVFLFGGQSDDTLLARLDQVVGTESDGSKYQAKWMSIHTFRKGKAILYPEGLLEMLVDPVVA